MDYAQMKEEKDKRLAEYNETYADQLRLLGYIDSLERDNQHLIDMKPVTGRDKRRAKKLTKINDKDIKLYKKILERMPEVPPFK